MLRKLIENIRVTYRSATPLARVTLFLVFLLVLASVSAATFLLGVATGLNEFFPSKLVEKVQRRLGAPVQANRIDRLSTTFFPIDVEYLGVPQVRGGYGGGMTQAGEAIVLLTHDGRLFTVEGGGERGERELRQLDIEAPDNGVADFAALKGQEEYRDYSIEPHLLRFNDVLYLESGDRRAFAASYTEFDKKNTCFTNTVAVLDWPDGTTSVLALRADKGDWRILHRTTPCLPLKRQYRAIEGHMAGGRMAFIAPSTLLLASGEYHFDNIYGPFAVSQDRDKEYGKVLSIDTNDGSVHVISIGNRNTQGITVDAEGRIWVTEHGLRGGDELDLIHEGANFGWPFEGYGTLYNMAPIPNLLSYGRHDTYEKPIYAWVPSVATSHVTQIRNFHDAWNGDLFVTTFKGLLFRLHIRDGRVIFAERIEFPGYRFRNVLSHTDGTIVLWTDEYELIFLRPAAQSYATGHVEGILAAMDVSDALRAKLKVSLDTCSQCHSFDARINETAPNLADVFGRQIGSTPFRGYSPALLSKDERWTDGALAQYLDDPKSFAPGTTMPDPNIDDPELTLAIIDFLKAIESAD